MSADKPRLFARPAWRDPFLRLPLWIGAVIAGFSVGHPTTDEQGLSGGARLAVGLVLFVEFYILFFVVLALPLALWARHRRAGR
jgi:hypothetical protein